MWAKLQTSDIDMANASLSRQASGGAVAVAVAVAVDAIIVADWSLVL